MENKQNSREVDEEYSQLDRCIDELLDASHKRGAVLEEEIKSFYSAVYQFMMSLGLQKQ